MTVRLESSPLAIASRRPFLCRLGLHRWQRVTGVVSVERDRSTYGTRRRCLRPYCRCEGWQDVGSTVVRFR